MRALIQRVREARAAENGPPSAQLASIRKGLLILVGFEETDTLVELDQVVQKIKNLRVFSDGEGKMNLPGSEVGAEYLIVSQFTLFADLKYGNRPSFTKAAPKAKAKELYEHFAQQAARMMGTEGVHHTPFGSDLAVELVNDGPVTLWVDSKEIL